MTDIDPDAELRRRFQALAQEEADHVPRYVRPSTGGINPAPTDSAFPAWITPALTATVLILTATALLLLDGRPAPSSDPMRAMRIDLAAVAWIAPTDFLLDTPGTTLLRKVPQFEVDAPAGGMNPAPTAPSSTNPAPTKPANPAPARPPRNPT